jgi:recombination protein RecA
MKVKILSDKEMAKKYPQSSTAIKMYEAPKFRLPCRVIPLTHQIGGGIPYGRIVELFGYESSGKSLLAMDFGYAAQQLGGVLLWADAEQTFDPAWAIALGLEMDRVIILNDNALEKTSDWVRDQILYWRSRLTRNEPIVCVIDSLAALECEEKIDADQSGGKAEMGGRAKGIGTMFRKRVKLINTSGAILIAINQVRKKLNASIYEIAETTPGGEATKFFASIRICREAFKNIKGKVSVSKSGAQKFTFDRAGTTFGRQVKISIRKNKTSATMDPIWTDVHFRPLMGKLGFAKYKGLLNVLIEKKIITQKGSRYYLKDKMLANGEDNFETLIETDDVLRSKLIKRAKLNTISNFQSLLDGEGKNYYPLNAIEYEE